MKKLIGLFVLFYCFGYVPYAQVIDTDPQYLSLFGPEKPLRIVLRFQMDSLINDVGEDSRKHNGHITWEHLPDEYLTIDVRAETRGNFRRKKEYCAFPPLELSFKKKEREGTIFDKFKKLDLVTHCQDEEKYRQYVLKEYLAYRLYNLITPYSYKVRLLEVEYQDMDGSSRGIFPGFFTEENDELKDRIPGDDIKDEDSKQHEDLFKPSLQFSVFQYMIGNTDWNLPYEHNVRLLTHEITGDTLAVPFDFDHSGLVNAEYATAYRVYQLKSPRQRIWLGRCFEYQEISDELKAITDLRKEARDLVRNIPGIDRETERDTWQFLNEFFRDFTDSETVERIIQSSCGVYH